MVRVLRLIGGLVVAPRSALGAIDGHGTPGKARLRPRDGHGTPDRVPEPSRDGLPAGKARLRPRDQRRGGVAAALLLLAAGTLSFRLPELVMAVHGAVLGAGVVMRVVSVVARELRDALWIVLPAALAVTVLAGRRRDPGADLELGAAGYVPWFVVQAPLQAAVALGVPLPPVVPRVGGWVAMAAAAAMTVLAALQARRRRLPSEPPEDSPALPRGRAPLVATAALGVVLLSALTGGILTARRPVVAGGFTLPRVNGPGEVSLAAERGKLVLLDFWATWCPPCVAMLPTLRGLHQRWAGQGLVIIGVNSDGEGSDPAFIRDFVARESLPYPVVIDDGRLVRHYGVTAFPHLVLVGGEGQVRQTFWGPTSAAELDAAVRREIGR